MEQDWVQMIASILSGLAVCIPLVYKLIESVKTAAKEKNWGQLLSMVSGYMEEAETKFDDGATRKEWVMAMIIRSSATVNYDIDMDVVSDMIDNLCKLTKKVNAPVKTEELPKAE